jgi:hypothetical protein
LWCHIDYYEKQGEIKKTQRKGKQERGDRSIYIQNECQKDCRLRSVGR